MNRFTLLPLVALISLAPVLGWSDTPQCSWSADRRQCLVELATCEPPLASCGGQGFWQSGPWAGDAICHCHE
jgi:hypothetical protein